MGNSLFAYPDRTLTATLAAVAGTTFNATLPLTNLKDRLRGKVARSSSSIASPVQFDITLSKANPIRIVAITDHNFSATATVTLSFGTTLGGTQLGTYASLPVWGQFYPPGAVEWQDPEFWSLKMDPDDIAAYKRSPDMWLALPQTISPSYIRVSISDTANTDGYVEMGRVFCAPAFQPSINIEFGASISWQQDVIVDKSVGGVEWFTILSEGREAAVTLSNMSVAEGMVAVFDRQRRLGLEGELFFIFDPDDTILLYKQRCMLCRFASLDPLQFPYHDGTSSSFALKEVR